MCLRIREKNLEHPGQRNKRRVFQRWGAIDTACARETQRGVKTEKSPGSYWGMESFLWGESGEK